ncbi:MAG: hypothetical protein ACRD5D_07910, partial [Candidatus Polarisedimenticolia bacterium]
SRTRNGWKPAATFVLAAALAAAAGAPEASAATYDFLFSVDRVRDDTQYFLHLAVQKYGHEEAVLRPVLPRLRSVEEDLPVLLFLANKSVEPLEAIAALRARGFSWAVIFDRARVPVKVLFRGLTENPGPPYGKAWGYWKKNPQSVRLSDRDIAGLAQIQIGARWAKMSALELARARGQGKKVVVLVAERKGRPWRAASAAKTTGPGRGKGQQKTRGPEER